MASRAPYFHSNTRVERAQRPPRQVLRVREPIQSAEFQSTRPLERTAFRNLEARLGVLTAGTIRNETVTFLQNVSVSLRKSSSVSVSLRLPIRTIPKVTNSLRSCGLDLAIFENQKLKKLFLLHKTYKHILWVGMAGDQVANTFLPKAVIGLWFRTHVTCNSPVVISWAQRVCVDRIWAVTAPVPTSWSIDNLSTGPLQST